jgi:murein DD-endopeptidase MepM/ murein hydrolase activator NlpD
MMNNKDLYHFDQEQDSTELDPELTSPENSKFSFLTKLLHQTIIAICCLILILTFYHSKLPWLQWVSNRMHSAVNASQEDTFGRISSSKLFKTIITNATNLVRLEEITKGLAGQETLPKEQEKKIFSNSVWPVQGSITKGYGWRYDPANKTREFNSGVEITAVPDTSVLAIADGTIAEIKHQPGNGWEIVINHGDGWSSTYYYLGVVNAKVGQMVKAGDPIAQIGRPDQEKGPTLLLEIKDYDQPIDPLSLLVS